jgi:hypothetical protein
MKKLIAGIACLALSVGAFAQGTVIFNNSPGAIGGSGAPIYNIDGVTPLDGNYLAILFAGPDAGSMEPIGLALPFRTGAGQGFFNTAGQDTTRVIPSVLPGAQATIVVKAWEAAGGTTFDQARLGGYAYGESAAFSVTTGGAGEPPSLPQPLVGLTSFSLVPEPSTYALLALGAGALMLIRRRKTA